MMHKSLTHTNKWRPYPNAETYNRYTAKVSP